MSPAGYQLSRVVEVRPAEFRKRGRTSFPFASPRAKSVGPDQRLQTPSRLIVISAFLSVEGRELDTIEQGVVRCELDLTCDAFATAIERGMNSWLSENLRWGTGLENLE